jgi:ubiquitin conjugation factor E4 B
MLNDSVYLLDEMLKILQEIKQQQDDFNNKTIWNNFSKEEQDSKSQNYRQNEGKILTYCLLAKETVHMFNFISRDAPDPFLRPEMIKRVASLLNYFLIELAGSKCQNLKVQNQEKYGFDPKFLISEITDIYRNLQSEDFYLSVAEDERSFDYETFTKTIGILKKINTRQEKEIKEFERIIQKCKEVNDKKKEEEEELGDDIPDEFLDPITYTIMVDPVKMPSGMSIERSSIERHLLNEQNDPFNRQHLTIDMLVEDTDLKEQIKKWREVKKQSKN